MPFYIQEDRMNKVLVIGNTGAGKTTFSQALHEKTGLPLVHLDKLYWCGQWEHVSREEFDAALENELAQPAWIIDGNFHRTLPRRLECCDTVFFFDLPTLVCLWGVIKRIFTHYGKTRADMGGNCPEYFDRNKISLYRAALAFNKTRRREYLSTLENTQGVQVIIFRSRREARKYLDALS